MTFLMCLFSSSTQVMTHRERGWWCNSIAQPMGPCWEVGTGGQCPADLLEIRDEFRAPHGSCSAHQSGARFSGADGTGPCYAVRLEKKTHHL